MFATNRTLTVEECGICDTYVISVLSICKSYMLFTHKEMWTAYLETVLFLCHHKTCYLFVRNLDAEIRHKISWQELDIFFPVYTRKETF